VEGGAPSGRRRRRRCAGFTARPSRLPQAVTHFHRCQVAAPPPALGAFLFSSPSRRNRCP
jgi:hypothetical protein